MNCEKQGFEPVILTPGPGEPRGLLAFLAIPCLNRTRIDQLKQWITQVNQLTCFFGSELICDLKDPLEKKKNPIRLWLSRH